MQFISKHCKTAIFKDKTIQVHHIIIQNPSHEIIKLLSDGNNLLITDF